MSSQFSSLTDGDHLFLGRINSVPVENSVFTDIYDMINKILISVIVMCVGGIFFVSYKFIRFMELVGLSTPARAIKEMMLFFVYTILFGLVISTTVRLLRKLKKYTREDKWSAKTPILGVA